MITTTTTTSWPPLVKKILGQIAELERKDVIPTKIRMSLRTWNELMKEAGVYARHDPQGFPGSLFGIPIELGPPRTQEEKALDILMHENEVEVY